jgi:hypothetical protein
MPAATFIDLYCERTGPGLWNEPANTLSNLAFVIAALLAWRARARRQTGDIWEAGIILLAGLIGLGSFLFHIFATRWAELADIIPIWSFVACYVVLTIYRNTHHDAMKTLRITVIAASLTLIIVWLTANPGIINDAARSAPAASGARASLPLNGSLQYAPAWAALIVFTLLARLRKHPAARYLTAAMLVFSASLIFRTIDLAVCEATHGLGTHFLWHLLNGLMIGLLLWVMVHRMPPVQRHTP